MAIGNDGTGAIAIENGGTVENGRGFVGTFDGSDGTATVDGIGSVWINRDSLEVGGRGAAFVAIKNGGLVTVDGDARIGRSSMSDGTLS